jgi:hypothetical protein
VTGGGVLVGGVVGVLVGGMAGRVVGTAVDVGVGIEEVAWQADSSNITTSRGSRTLFFI